MKKVLFVTSLCVMLPAFGAEVLTRPVVQEESLKDLEKGHWLERALWFAVNGLEDTNKLKELLDGGMSPDSVCQLAMTRLPVLHLAVLAGNLEGIKVLVERGADLKVCDGEFTALHYAVRIKKKDSRNAVVSYLLERDIDLDAQVSTYGTVLHYAVQEGYADTVSLLLTKVNVNSINEGGKTPLFDAIYHGHIDILKDSTRLKVMGFWDQTVIANSVGLTSLNPRVAIPTLRIFFAAFISRS